MSTKYDNTEWHSLARTGGAIVVTIELDPDYGPLGVHPVSYTHLTLPTSDLV